MQLSEQDREILRQFFTDEQLEEMRQKAKNKDFKGILSDAVAAVAKTATLNDKTRAVSANALSDENREKIARIVKRAMEKTDGASTEN